MSQIKWLDSTNVDFPPLSEAMKDPSGLLAAGGDLQVDRLISAYKQGIFPWYDDSQPILWWSPNPRSVLFPDQLHISKSLGKTLRKKLFSVTSDQAFSAVIEACSQAREYTSGTWITREMKDAYNELHKTGLAHSIEVWQDSKLVGGLYGVALGKVFFGESMFSRLSNASKIGFVFLVKQLQEWGYVMVDCQIQNNHLDSLGAELIDRELFSNILQESAYVPNRPQHWQLSWCYSQH